MKALWLFISLFYGFAALAQSTNFKSGFNLEEAKVRCASDFVHSKTLYSNDVHWGYSIEEMAQDFTTIYNSGKRLSYHSTYDAITDNFYVHYDDSNNKTYPVKLTKGFIKSVTQQIENALQAGYADYVFFPDMGHSHLYFPEEHWQKNYAQWKLDPEARRQLYEAMLADPQMRPLYHTCEQLKMQDENKALIDDDFLKFRYWNRNVLGKNDESGDLQIEVNSVDNFNTVREVPGHYLFSAGYNISASREGCFPYKTPEGQILYFDISLSDLKYDPKASSNNDDFLF
ncbi:MAG: hypothetical protein KDD33_10995 [Bdellovibrionales bacterium]|nr:hypothetical protein [Bdellovibrionales bacterium]